MTISYAQLALAFEGGEPANEIYTLIEERYRSVVNVPEEYVWGYKSGAADGVELGLRIAAALVNCNFVMGAARDEVEEALNTALPTQAMMEDFFKKPVAAAPTEICAELADFERVTHERLAVTHEQLATWVAEIDTIGKKAIARLERIEAELKARGIALPETVMA